MDQRARIYVAGHTGMVGAAVVRRLRSAGYDNLALRTRAELDLTDQVAVREFMAEERPAYVVDCAARVGGIKANMTFPAEFLYENLQIQNNLIWSAKEAGVGTFLFLGSSCIYPRGCPQPMREEYFMTGRPEPTNEAYAYAKIAGMKLCEYIHAEFGRNFVSCMPTNIYGEGDNFDLGTSHVIPALVRRMHEAREAGASEVVIWGTGNSRREFLHVDDLADAVLWLLRHHRGRRFLNVGTGQDISIRELAERIRHMVGFEGSLAFDASKPDGMPRKLLDVSALHESGWRHRIEVDEGLRRTCDWYLTHITSIPATA
ncbi:GDP-L-fucose synthase [Streptomyces sp. NBC_01571]|uniref:GDP-L-fucose synthase family protein n=1 Tax=Streptomyces sp. NBC_01571 TaxID=2975883 RepID=UPI002251A59A|nr:GDP-L-fucose synthase [Streptomyces sp. NBC_01571]MCX4579346.1 GDP-L-fucose synthase [Streptomyces sp. NBC_01571]